MLQRMLDAHPRLAVAYDTLFIPRMVRDVAVGEDPALTPELVGRAVGHPRFSRLGISGQEVVRASRDAQTVSQFVHLVYDALARLRGKELSGEKSPGYCRHIETLHALFPDARFIHLIRDGRDVALSIREWKKGCAKLDLSSQEPIATAALWWRRDIEAGRRGGMAIGPDRYMEIHYENLVDDSPGVLASLCGFLGLEYDGRMVSYHEGRRRSAPGLSAKAAWLPPTRGLRDWRRSMSARDQALFEAIAGGQLESLGYARGSCGQAQDVRQTADDCERWWSANIEVRPQQGLVRSGS